MSWASLITRVFEVHKMGGFNGFFVWIFFVLWFLGFRRNQDLWCNSIILFHERMGLPPNGLQNPFWREWKGREGRVWGWGLGFCASSSLCSINEWPLTPLWVLKWVKSQFGEVFEGLKVYASPSLCFTNERHFTQWVSKPLLKAV
jgi:hypothetical protein